MRKARSKVRKNFSINKPGSEEFAKMLEECTIEKEVAAAFKKGEKAFNKLDPEIRMQKICDTLI